MLMLYEKHGIAIREAVLDDAEALKDSLRDQDVAEVMASGSTPEEALRHSIEKSSMAYAIEYNGVVVGAFGIVPDTLIGASAIVWLLGTPELSRIKKSFVRLGDAMIAGFLLRYPILHNIVDARYKQAIRWLKHCGAVFAEKPVDIGGNWFYHFSIGRTQ